MSEFSRNLAFVIGINNYTNGINTLQNAENDAKKLKEVLRKKHGYKVFLYLNEKANLSNLNQLLEKTLLEKVSENDRVLFYFAGHGIALNGDDGPQGYLIPQDAKLGDSNTYLPMSKLQESLDKLTCRHFLAILDCCFAGAFRWSNNRETLPERKVIYQQHYDRFVAEPAWQVITSAAYDQKALDALNFNRKRDSDNSPFTAALIEALEGNADTSPPATNNQPPGDGVITATELYMYLRDMIEPATEEQRHRQTPGIHQLKKHDKGEFIFLCPGHPLNLKPAPQLDSKKVPYRGLKSFREEHSELFFGRDKLVEKLSDFIKDYTLTVVLGASGSGKSSLVRAGLIPKLEEGEDEKWDILERIRPGKDPLKALNNVLKKAELPEVIVQNPQQNLAHSIKVWAENNPNSKLLLFIDQAEEIITLCKDEDKRKEFYQQILKAIQGHRDKLRVVLTLRSDFEPQIRDAGLKFVPTEFDDVGDAELRRRWQRGRFLVTEMTRRELQEAIEKPAEARVMYFQPNELVEQLIDEVVDMPGALPLLSFTLRELYFKYLERQQDGEEQGIIIDRALTEQDYQELGGVIQSLTKRADEEYDALVKKDSAYAQVIKHVMLRMIALGGTQLARRQVPLSELKYPSPKDGLVKKVIEGFTKARLLVEGQDDDGNFYVEPAHDALIQAWEKLLVWREENKENLTLQPQLTWAAQEWKKAENKDKEQFLWNSNPKLEQLKQILNSNDNWFNKTEKDFVQRSINLNRSQRHRRIIIAVSFLTIFAGFIRFQFWFTSIVQINPSLRALAATSEALFYSDKNAALVESIKAGHELKQVNKNWVKPHIRTQVIATLHQVLYGQDTYRVARTFKGHSNSVNSFSFSPDGKFIATASEDNTVKLWDASTGKEIKTLQGHSNSVNSVSFSPDGQTIASASEDNTVKLWNISTGEVIKTLPGHSNFVNSVSFSPDGKFIASASGDNTVKLWDASTGKEIKTLQGHSNSVNSVSFSPDGKFIASASGDNTVKLWDVNTGEEIETLQGHSNFVDSVSFSPDGKTIASASGDNTVKLWDASTMEKIKTLEDDSFVNSVSFSPDGKTIASASGDNTVKFWDVSTRKEIKTLEDHSRGVKSLSFTADGKTIASASGDKTVKLWDARTGKEIKTLKGHSSFVNSVSFTADGKTIASASGDNTVKLWDVNTGEVIKTLKGHSNGVNSVSFSADGEFIASASGDKTVKLWDVSTGEVIKTLKGHSNGVNSVSFSADGRTIASASGDKTVKLWNISTGEVIKTLEGHSSFVDSVSFSADGRTIASASADKTVKLWDASTGKEIKTLKGHSDGVKSVSFSSDGKTLVSASADNTIKLWHVRTRKQIKTFKGHLDDVNSVSFSADGKTIASASDDNTVKLWNLDLENLLAQGCDWLEYYFIDNRETQKEPKVCQNPEILE